MVVKPLPPHASSPYYGDAAFNAFMPMAAVYTLIANLAVGILRPLGLFPRPKPLLIAPDTNKGKLAIVTGSNTGIGFETAQALVNSGFDVILACRSRDKALQAIDRIHQQRTSIEGKALFLCPLDLSSLESVKEFSDAVKARYSQVHVLVNNAGRNSSPQDASCNGLNVCFQTNFLGHFLLTNELLDYLQGGRVVNLASVMHHFCANNKSHDQDYWRECATSTEESYYAPSKLAAILFTLELNRRYTASRRIRSMAVNPGAVNSDIWRDFPKWIIRVFDLFYLNSRQGCYTSVAAALNEFDPTQVYLQPYCMPAGTKVPFPMIEMMGPFCGYRVTEPRLPDDDSEGIATAQCLWEVSEELTGCEYPAE